MNEIILSIIAGLTLFLFSVINLSEILELAIGDKARIWIKRYTSHIFSSLLVGMIVTTLLGSSSAAIIITILFVNSQILTFRQAMGIVMGANIGTTISSQIIALDIGRFSPILLGVGFILLLISRTPAWKNSGKVIIYFGILFFGLFTMEQAVTPLKDEDFFLEWMKKTETPIVGALVGAIVTLVIQSSSATVGMAIVLAKKGLLSLTGGVAVMLGAELGTCSDTLLATIKGSRQALKTGLFHLLFNLITIILGLIFFFPFLNLVEFLSTSVSIERAVANAHMLFNFLGVFLLVWTIPLFEWGLNKLIPDIQQETEYKT
jgi:phosphate:Na+ symporter